jgi:SulP family sulfate permease
MAWDWRAAMPRIPALDWGRRYGRETLTSDLVAAVIVTIMLIPQSLAYAMLAGLPAEAGLYASVAPLLLYALFGTSSALAVGPVAVVSLMTATSLGALGLSGAAYAQAALTLAALSGGMLLVLGVLRLGFLANFLSHPVISGFISASGLLIAAGQVKTLLGIKAQGGNLIEIARSLIAHAGDTQPLTLLTGGGSMVFLFWVRKRLKPTLVRWGLPPRQADLAAKVGPVFAIAATAGLSAWLGWAASGMAVVGHIPQGLPPLTMPSVSLQWVSPLLMPALLISIVGFVESVSVGQTLAAKRRQRIEPNQELVAIGASNLGAAFTGGFPVTGGFARSVVNFDAGARTPAAGVFTAVGILLASLLLTPALYHLPQATLAATIVVAVLSLVDLNILGRTWVYARSDFAAVLSTLLVTLLVGVEAGLVVGVAVSLLLHLYRTSQPHMAIVGLVPGTQHFRNVSRHRVISSESVLTLRVDESLYFANARSLEDAVNDAVATRPALRHVVLMCSAINDIDASALESLEAINHRLGDAGIRFHLSEVKGPVMDRLERSSFLGELTGRVHLSQYQAYLALCPELLERVPPDAAQAGVA